ncbi:MAG: HEAT repeat domain-containing protein, partial [Pirellulaceae bacterium]|nr:HEAT repeat domain-containing protein [Pirellulaceae bacterium]
MTDISSLSSDLSSPDAEVRRAAAERLASLEADARPAAVPLVRCCGDADERVREWAAAALEQMGPPDV